MLDFHVHIDRLDDTAADWQLYSRHPGAAAAAAAINTALVGAVNEGRSRNEVCRIVQQVMHEHADTGAADTEPRERLGDLLDRLFGRA